MKPVFQPVCLILLFFMYSFSSFSQENPNPSSMLDAIIASEMELERFPGVSAVIVKDGQIVWIQSYGMADIEQNIPVENTTVFLLASISKVFTGTAAMQLHENSAINQLAPPQKPLRKNEAAFLFEEKDRFQKSKNPRRKSCNGGLAVAIREFHAIVNLEV